MTSQSNPRPDRQPADSEDSAVEILPAYDDLDTLRALWREYAAYVQVDLGFQNFERELTRLPDVYAPPSGRLYLARCDGQASGCIALRPLKPDACEMKRLFVRPAFRGRNIGALLAQTAVAEARAIGYDHMFLDTLTTLPEALSLYRRMGFRETAPYNDNPLDTAVFLRLDLSGS